MRRERLPNQALPADEYLGRFAPSVARRLKDKVVSRTLGAPAWVDSVWYHE